MLCWGFDKKEGKLENRVCKLVDLSEGKCGVLNSGERVGILFESCIFCIVREDKDFFFNLGVFWGVLLWNKKELI